MRASAGLAILLLASSASADALDASTGTRWAVTARSGYSYLGPSKRPTGGMTITATGERVWPLGEAASVGFGPSLTAFGFETGGRWLAILGGPSASIRSRVAGPVGAGLALHLDAGRLPTSNAWGLCMLYSGLFPAAVGSLRYAPSDRIAVDATGGARVVRTLGWSGAGGEGGVAATIRF